MAIYTFYPCRDDGSAATFEAIELGGDEPTGPVAAAVLARHESAASVSIWQSDRYVGHVKRAAARLFGAQGSPNGGDRYSGGTDRHQHAVRAVLDS